MLPPGSDLYVILGVTKEATIAEIRAAHRERVRKCRPDRIQDESQRNAAQEELEQVEDAYEILSDDHRRVRYDQLVRLRELKRDLLARRRESRQERTVEESMPKKDLDEGMRFTDESPPMPCKHDDFRIQPKPKETGDKEETRKPEYSYRSAKEPLRSEGTGINQADLSDNQNHEPRWQDSVKSAYMPFTQSDLDSDSVSNSSEPYIVLDKEYPGWSRNKHNLLLNLAEEHIQRCKYGTRRSRSTQRHYGYVSAKTETSASRPVSPQTVIKTEEFVEFALSIFKEVCSTNELGCIVVEVVENLSVANLIPIDDAGLTSI
ncbi:uncharacterized protein N7496_000532 [Penicillium cataractarum]|uniref:J domain-containing protein n=1 Tax=Penicillium cataractarum TaxID=2100454 RepID=A0A9X0B609_9EURO|nr:uncharacterized protein N7496_000532 [Penicillium cataractarum]KAJ5389464.1 hypothetical protein N7496_000532 [Penicillium cataractarum]